MFHLPDDTARIHDSSLLISPAISIHTEARDETSIMRERECIWGEGTQEDRSSINFDCVQVGTPAACVPTKC